MINIWHLVTFKMNIFSRPFFLQSKNTSICKQKKNIWISLELVGLGVSGVNGQSFTYSEAGSKTIVGNLAIRYLAVLSAVYPPSVHINPWKKPEMVEKGGKGVALEIDSPPNDTK